MSERTVLSIKDLNRYIKMKLEGDNRLQDVWLQGEISNFTRHSSGHMYFTLKDADSRLKSIMFASFNQKLSFLPREGMRVLARGSISVYERDGQYQFYAREMQPDGVGGLYLAYEQLKKKLEAEGLFAPERKKAIPTFPRAVGVITSPTGAAVRDVLITLQRRYPMVPVILYPVLVQGTQAAPSIVRAIAKMNELREVDVMIVGRGGGSLEELWAFNEEAVARGIAASHIPIISAVGHETDFTIADFVADLRAATPTAAAELAVPHQLELKRQLADGQQRLHQALQRTLQRRSEALERLRRSPYLVSPQRQLLMPAAQQLDRMEAELAMRMRQRLSRAADAHMRLDRRMEARSPRANMLAARQQSEAAGRALRQAMSRLMQGKRQEFGSRLRSLDALSPLKVMQRGYSLVYDEREQKLVNSIEQVQIGDVVNVRLTDGQLQCHVWSMEEKNNE
ncbi:exodeoxyribonuclease VII large subunit [Paenibacillus sp. N1-5-1-14]|uniref:exodeoxyribonuclease VII large subunit n=1 Tax=Paenibacillus radicibacter TaxID=2972488 RepID=UPI0021597FC8|nr:exodeoxyribonuclease VII large subunit [Paenibacillus radicibacter]MCR8642409.1 exodeoxyribonuclease VII large subunit [Paenibacillus radicibacter]